VLCLSYQGDLLLLLTFTLSSIVEVIPANTYRLNMITPLQTLIWILMVAPAYSG